MEAADHELVRVEERRGAHVSYESLSEYLWMKWRIVFRKRISNVQQLSDRHPSTSLVIVTAPRSMLPQLLLIQTTSLSQRALSSRLHP